MNTTQWVELMGDARTVLGNADLFPASYLEAWQRLLWSLENAPELTIDEPEIALPERADRMTETQFGEWLAALKSGEWRQGQNSLFNWNDWEGSVIRYCCLGVLRALEADLRPGDVPAARDYPSSCAYPLDEVLVQLNDEGPIDQFVRVIRELESCPELYITQR